MLTDWNATVPQTSLIKEYNARLSTAILSVLGETTVDTVGYLVDSAVIDLQEKAEIVAQKNTVEKASKLLSVISKANKSMKQFDQLLNVLSGEEHRELVHAIRQRYGKLLTSHK